MWIQRVLLTILVYPKGEIALFTTYGMLVVKLGFYISILKANRLNFVGR